MTRHGMALVWDKLCRDGAKSVTSDRIEEIANQLGKDKTRTIRYLQEHGYIERILKGIFYVKTPEERTFGTANVSKYELIAMAMKAKGVRRWFLGLETALKLNMMTHEYFAVDYVVTDSFRTTKVIDIMGSKFRFVMWSPRLHGFGLVRRGGIVWSDRDRSVLDIVHRSIYEGTGERAAADVMVEYADYVDKAKLVAYMQQYPPRVRHVVARLL